MVRLILSDEHAGLGVRPSLRDPVLDRGPYPPWVKVPYATVSTKTRATASGGVQDLIRNVRGTPIATSAEGLHPFGPHAAHVFALVPELERVFEDDDEQDDEDDRSDVESGHEKTGGTQQRRITPSPRRARSCLR